MESPRLISPLLSPAVNTLPAEINAATRQIHTQLNKLITSRLPLALPPYSSDPGLLAHGISAFSQIYFAFEASWQDLIQRSPDGNHTRSGEGFADDKGDHEARVHEYLATLVPPGLWRSRRLEQDNRHLGSGALPEFMKTAKKSAESEAFTDHIQTAVRERPHVLIAYSWVMYMAIFSGGRWIRQQLLEAGPEFWHAGTSQDENRAAVNKAMPGVSFLSFDGPSDGEDIKAQFKLHLQEAESLLTEHERQDVIDEANTIFRGCISIVMALDAEIGAIPDVSTSRPAAITDGTAGKRELSYKPMASCPVPSGSSSWPSHRLTVVLTVFAAFALWYALRLQGSA